MNHSDGIGSHLSIDEKISLLSAEGLWHTASVQGVPGLQVSYGRTGSPATRPPRSLRKTGAESDAVPDFLDARIQLMGRTESCPDISTTWN